MIALAYLHPGWVPHEFMTSVIKLTNARDDIVRVCKRSGPGIARNRNTLAAWFLAEKRLTHMLWVDADMVFEPDALQRLLDTDEALVAGLAMRVNEQTQPSPAAVVKGSGGYIPVSPEQLRQPLVPVDGVGMAFTLVHRDVYEATEVSTGHPHRERFSAGGILLGEDVGFCQYAVEKGFQPMLATDVHIGHVKSRAVWP